MIPVNGDLKKGLWAVRVKVKLGTHGADRPWLN